MGPMNKRGRERELALDNFQDRLGYHFRQRAFLDRALVHTSFVNECKQEGVESNERLEFLGDAVLELLVSDLLFRAFPDEPEGVLTKKRIQMVCEPSFAFLGRSWGLPDLMVLGNGEEQQGGRKKDSIVSDAFEALCGAIYLDGGYDFLYTTLKAYLPKLEDLEEKDHSLFLNYKSAFQERVQKAGKTFEYKLVGEEGPPHDKIFRVQVFVNGRKLAQGEGKSKKAAEQDAAKAALEKMKRKGCDSIA